MRIFRRYLLGEIAGPFLIGLGIIMVLFLIQKIFVLTDWAMNRGVNLWDILRLLLYLMPLILYIILPMVTLFAILLALGRLSSDSEIIALKASGVSLYRLLPPLLLFAGLIFAVCLSLSLEWIPRFQRDGRELRFRLLQRYSEAGITPRTFVDFLPQMVFYARESDPAGLKGVMISQEIKSADRAQASPEEIRMAFAETGHFLHNPETLENVLVLDHGSFHIHNLKRDVYQVVEFEQSRFRLDFDQGQNHGETPWEEMGLSDLLVRRREIRAALEQPGMGKAALKKLRQEWRELMVSLHEKLAFSCGCLILAFWAVPLGIQPPRSGRLRSVILSVLLAGIYNYLLVLGKALALKGLVDPAAALWLPNAVILLSGLYLLDHQARERPVPLLTWLEDMVSHLEERLRRKFGGAGDSA